MESGRIVDDVVAIDVEGLRLHLSVADEHSRAFFGRHVGGRYHEDAISALWLSFLEHGSRVLDLGCHVGWYTCVTGVAAPNATTVAFDIDPRLLSICRRNVNLNSYRHAMLVHAAVTNEDGGQCYYQAGRVPSATASILMVDASARWTRRRSARSLSVDTWCNGRGFEPTLVKVDLEGAEWLVLDGMKHTLAKFAPVLFVELHPSLLLEAGVSAEAVIDRLRSTGYRQYEVEKMKDQRGRVLTRRLDRGSTLRTVNPVLLCEAGPCRGHRRQRQ